MIVINRIFKDVEVGRWSEQAIRKCVELGIVHGFDDGTFRPSEKISREEMCNIIYRLF